MTLNEFLAATTLVPEPVVRSAMAAALAVEPARTPDARRRFYTRVLRELGVRRCDPGYREQPREAA